MYLQMINLLTGITDLGFASGLTSIAAALAAGIPGFAVALGQGNIAAKAVEAVGRQPEAKNEIQQVMIIGQGISETSAIYGLLIAFILIFVA
ncbi:MAG: ATP synthase F0 subunit C [Defluviitaleaceae bacterium]|nr:ATP synthase F0 subunit C [Defluviitaleaceae bacterium]